MSKLEKEIYKNRRLMRFNTALTLKEQTDTLTITPRMFELMIENERLRPIIDESIQKELDKVREKELKSHYFGDVWEFVSKPKPEQVDLNILWPGKTDLPCPTCLAYDAVKNWELSVGLFTLTLKDIDSDSINLKATGWVGIDDVKIPFKAFLKANYWLKEDILYYSLEDVELSSSVKLPLYPFKLQLSYSKIRITNDFWCDGTCWRIDPGLEDAIIEEFGTREFDVGPLYDESKGIKEG
jgi:hypothetical protein